jgi:hypothetical protein
LSARHDRNRRELARAASEAFGELQQLMAERVRVRLAGRQLLRELASGGSPLAAGMRGEWPESLITYLEGGGCPPDVLARVAGALAGLEAGLSERIEAFHDHPLADALAALAEAQTTLMAADQR